MATEHFCLRWNNHQSTLVSVFDNLLESGTLVDCTLAADGRYLKAHKVVLSACSPYLGMLLSQHYDKHPIIILKDVKFDELKAMLDYMYRGEVNISQEQLSTFLKAAETLQIKGLTDAGSDEGNGLQPNRPPSSTSTTSANEDPPSPGPPGEGGSSPGPRKRKRNKHGDDGEGDSMSKISLSESSDRLSGTSVGSPSAKSASVKREPGDGEGDGQMSVDESGEVVMMSRPGPSNGGTNNKAPWILSADSSGEEMQLTPGQDGRCNGLVLENGDIKEDGEENENAPEIIEEGEIREEIKREVEDQFDLGTNQHQEENRNGTLLIAVARDREELIVPDTLEVSPFLFEKNYHHPPPKSVSETVQKNNKQQEANNQKVILKDNLPGIDCQLDTKLTIVKPTEESPSKRSPEKCMLEPAMRSNTGTVKKVRWNVVSQNSASHLRSLKKVIEKVHISSDGPETLDNSHSQSCLKSSSPAKGSKTVVRVADVFNTNKVKVKKTRLDFLTKYRKILPAPEDESGKVSSFQIVGARIPPASVEQSINQSLPQPSATPASGENQPDNLTRMPPTNTLNPKETKAINHSEIQGSSLEQKVNQNPSLIQISQQFQGSQFLSNTPNALLMPQQLQTGQVNSLGQAVLTIPPQFSIPSPVQAGNFQMQFSNNSNIPSGNIQMMNNLSGVITQGQVSQPVFVTSNIISTCQTSNQFLSSSPVQYNFSTPTAQPNCSVAVSQSTLTSATYQKINVPANPPSSSSILNSYGYLRRPRMRMRLTPKVGQVQSLRGRGEFSTHQAQGRLPLQSGRVPSVRPSLNLGPKPILPKP